MSKIPPVEDILQEIADHFGGIPAIYEPARTSAGALNSLWNAHQWAYAALPIPGRFKELLLSAIFSGLINPYALKAHALVLQDLGVPAADLLHIIEIVRKTRTRPCQRIPYLVEAGRQEKWPEPGSVLEEALLECATALCSNPSSMQCRFALEGVLGTEKLASLWTLLGYAQAVIFWLDSHPEIAMPAGCPEEARLEAYAREAPGLEKVLFPEHNPSSMLPPPVVYGLGIAERERLETILASAPGVVWEAWGRPDQADQRIFYVSPHAETMLGYSRDEWISTPNFWLGIVHPDDRERAAKLAREHFANGTPGINEYRWIAKDGHVLWVESHFTVVLDSDGRPVGLRGITMDVTPRRQAEMALRQVESRLRSIVDTNVIGFALSGQDGVIWDGNDAFLRLVGYSRQDLLDRQLCWDRLTPPQYVEADAEIRSQASEYGGFGPFEKELIRRDGILVPVIITGVMTGVDGEMMCLVLDLTDRKNAEQIRHRLADHIRLLLDSTGEGIIGIDERGYCTFINRSGAAMLGYQPSEVAGRSIHALLQHHREDGTKLRRSESAILRALRNGTSCHCDGEVFWRKDGTSLAVEYSSHPVIEEGAAQGAVINFFDITERRIAEEERDRLLESEKQARAAAEAERTRFEFLAEIGTVLSSSLNIDTTLRGVARLATKDLADWCVIDLLEGDGTVQRVATYHRDLAKNPLMVSLRHYPPLLESRNPISRVICTADSLRMPPDPVVEGFAFYDDEHKHIHQALQAHSAVIVPLIARGRVLGAVSLYRSETSHAFDEHDLSLAEEMARRAAAAIDNARLFAAEQEARRTAERVSHRMQRLHDIMTALGDTMTPAEVGDLIVREAMESMGAGESAVLRLTADGSSLEVVATRGFDPNLVDSLDPLPLDVPLPATHAVLTGQPVLIERVSEKEELDESVRRWAEETGTHAFAALPLMSNGVPSGVLVLSFHTVQQFEPDERSFLLAVADQCSLALERARLYEAEQDARRRMECLAEVTDILARTLDVEKALLDVTEVLAHSFAEYCVVDLWGEDGALRRVATSHRDPDIASRLRRIMPESSPKPGSGHPAMIAASTGTPVFLTDVSEHELERMGQSPEHGQMLLLLGMRSSVSAPIVSHGCVQGVISFATGRGGRRFNGDDQALAIEIAQRAAVILENAELHRAQQETLALLNTFVMSTPIGLAFLDTEMRYLTINQALADLNGIPVEEHLGRTLPEVLPGLTDAFTLLFQRVLATGEPILNHEVTDLAYGSQIPEVIATLSLYPVRVQNGEWLGVGCVVQDVTEQKRAEREIKDANRRVERILESVSDGFVAVDRDWRFVYANDRAARLVDLDRRQLLGQNLWESVPELVGTSIEDEIRHAMDLMVPVRFTEYVEAIDLWFDIHAYPTEEGLSIIFDDVTETMAAQRAVREGEERYRSLVLASSQIVWKATPDGKLDDSPLWLAFTGQREDQMSGHGWVESIHPDDRKQTLANWQKALDATTEYECQHRIRRADGVYRVFITRGVPVLDEGGSVREWVGTCTDITERTEAETALLRRGTQFEILSRTSRKINAVLEVPVILRQIVLGAIDLCGARAGAIGLVSDGILHIEECWKRGQWKSIDLQIEDGEGVPGWVLRTREPYVVNDAENDERVSARVRDTLGYDNMVAVPIPAPDGQVLGCLMIYNSKAGRPFDDQDVIMLQGLVASAATALENARLLEQTRAAEEALKTADRAKDHFLAILSHELRNPMAAISNASRLLQLVDMPDARVRRARKAIDRAAGLQARLLDDLLDVARITEGKIRLQKSRTSLHAVVRAVLSNLEPQASAQKLDLIGEYGEEAWVEADPVRLEQIINNLVLNAIKYTPSGSVTVISRLSGGNAVLKVIDTGIGMDTDMLEHAFDLFTQADSSLAHSGGGLGLGLALVKNLVQLHGGTVEATSDGPDKGATFTVTLPATEPPEKIDQIHPAVEEAPSASSDSNRASLRILLVDDNVDARETLREILIIYGYSVREAGDGHAALKAVDEEIPDVLLLDIGLPGLDGYEVVRRLRANPRTTHLRIVALTGYGQTSDKLRALESGFDAHVTKPVDIDRLETAMHG